MVKHEIQSVTKAILQVLGFFLSPLQDLDFFSFVLTIMNGWAWLLVIVTIVRGVYATSGMAEASTQVSISE